MNLMGKTETGRRRQNEDAFLIFEDGSRAVVAVSDGMGGHVLPALVGDLVLRVGRVQLLAVRALRLQGRKKTDAASSDSLFFDGRRGSRTQSTLHVVFR